MHTDKDLLVKGMKIMAGTLALMFLAPFTLYEAFKNQEHPLYLPVLVLGAILALLAVGLGFYGIKVIMDAVFSANKTSR